VPTYFASEANFRKWLKANHATAARRERNPGYKEYPMWRDLAEDVSFDPLPLGKANPGSMPG
jgi:hypothetical protein